MKEPSSSARAAASSARAAASSSVRAPGRPRDPTADRAILDATIRLLVEQGYDAMSLEGVASAAGVGKTTIYRRHSGKRELVVAAISAIAASLAPPVDSGSARQDLQAFVRQTLDVLRRDGLGFQVMGTLLVKERSEPDLIEQFRAAVLFPRMRIGADIVRRGMERGEIRPDIAVDVVIQFIAGSFFARHLVGQPDDDAWLDAAFDTLWRGIAAGH
jgi:AcrR family transcriptional regulator